MFKAETPVGGCSEVMPCAPLVLLDPYDSTACGEGVAAGDSCLVRCREGLQGTTEMARCPEAPPATAFGGSARTTWMSRSRRGQVAPVRSSPVGRAGWMPCRTAAWSAMGRRWAMRRRPPGGNARRAMPAWRYRPASPPAGGAGGQLHTGARCGAELHLEGCSPIVPCVRPSFGADICRFRADCPMTLMPGESCRVTCEAPYEGEATVALCPADNTVVGGRTLRSGLGMRGPGEATWPRPNCSFQVCPDPMAYSQNYTKDVAAPSGWRCADAMTGEARKRCESAPSVPATDAAYPRCQPQDSHRCCILHRHLIQEGVLSGCGLPQACVPFEAVVKPVSDVILDSPVPQTIGFDWL